LEGVIGSSPSQVSNGDDKQFYEQKFLTANDTTGLSTCTQKGTNKVREQLIMFSLENIKIIVQFCG